MQCNAYETWKHEIYVIQYIWMSWCNYWCIQHTAKNEKHMDWHKHHGPMAKIGQAQISCIIPLYPAILAKHPLLFSLNMKIPKLPIPRFPNNKNRIASPMKIHDKLTSQNAGAEGEGEQGLVLKAKASEILHGYIPELENLNTPRVGGKSHCFRSIFL